MIIIAPDKFKGSLTSIQVCDILEKGLLKYLPHENIKKFPLSDGGDGFLQVINGYHTGLCRKEMYIEDPLMEKEMKSWYLYDGNSKAYIETAESSGMKHLKKGSANPLNTSTFGIGQLIKDAIVSGISEIYIGLGGSSTTDGGIGVASALGFRFLDANGTELLPIGKNLIKIKSIKKPDNFYGARFIALADVQNPLFGPIGSAHVFAAQKGASVLDIELLDDGLKNLASIINSSFNIRGDQISGSGSAGGLAYGLNAFFNAEIRDGAQFFIDLSGVEDHFPVCRLLITGEGKIDEQTLMGKICGKIAKYALIHGITVFAVAGINNLEKRRYKSAGFSKIYQLCDKTISIEQSIEKSETLLLGISEEIGEYIFRNPSIIQ